jgi:protein TonB
MSVAYQDWSNDEEPQERAAPGTGMSAILLARGMTEPPRHRWKSMVLSIAGHLALVCAALFLTLGPVKKHELQTITVSIAQPKVSQLEPILAPKLERVPEVQMPDLPQIDTAAPPSPNAIRAAPPPVSLAPSENRKKTDDAQETPPRFDAGYLNNPAPVYPNMSRRLREVGVVQLRVRVSATGEPLELQLFKSSGYARLDDAARAAVQKWKFEAARRNGSAVEAWVIVPVEFSLIHS